MNLAQIANLLLALAAAFLFFSAVAEVIALQRGARGLRGLFRSAGIDFSSTLLKSPLVPGVSVLLPVSDASPESLALARRLLDLQVGRHEVVSVLDGLSPDDRSAWADEFRRVPGLVTVERSSGSALDTALENARYPVLGLVDPQAEFVSTWPLRVMRALLEKWDSASAVVAVSLAEPADTLPGRIAALEPLRRWLIRGAARQAPNLQGSCVLVKRDAVLAAGGFRHGAAALLLRLHAQQQSVAFLPERLSWRRPADTFGEARRQTLRDQSQFPAGMRLRVGVCPLVETAGLLLAAAGAAMGWANPALAWLVVLSSAGAGIVVSMTAVVLREAIDPGARDPRYLTRLFLAAIPENIGYRQWRNLWLIRCALGKRRRPAE